MYGLPGPEGLRVEEGDQVVVPAGSIRLSLDQSLSTARFSRPGLTWFVHAMLFEAVTGDLRDPSGLDQALGNYRRLADEVLQTSSLLVGLDTESAAVWRRRCGESGTISSSGQSGGPCDLC